MLDDLHAVVWLLLGSWAIAINIELSGFVLAKLRRNYRCVKLEECIGLGGVCSSAVLRPWARRRINHACDSDAWPLQRQTYGYLPSRRASLPFGQYQMLRLMTEADMCEQLASCHSKLSAIPAG